MTPADVPLVVDLDGTLHYADSSWVDFVQALQRTPWIALSCAVWILGGRARIKAELAARSRLDPARLDYDPRVLSWVGEERRRQRRIVLCTGANQVLAERIARHLGLFDEVIGSTAEVNLIASRKAQCLVERYGERGFDYAGNSRADLQVWPHCRNAIVVNASRGVHAAAQRACNVTRVFPRES